MGYSWSYRGAFKPLKNPVQPTKITEKHLANREMTSSTASNREKFVALAEKRVQKALQSIAVIGNLSNKSNYSYTEDDVKQIKKALLAQVNETIGRFNSTNNKSNTFSLK